MDRLWPMQSSKSRAAVVLVLVAAAVCSVAAPVAAQPTTTITFDEIEPERPIHALPAPYATQGFVFDCIYSDDGTPCRWLHSFGPTHAAYPGSPALFNNSLFGITTLARQDRGAFNIFALDLAPFISSAYWGPVVFEGTLADGGTVTETFAVSGVPGALTTFTFSSSFRNLRSFRYRGDGFGRAPTSVAVTVDNVVVQAVGPAGPAVVPEPSTWALLGTGLLAVGGITRRRGPPRA
jgi:hypothetical protein